MVMKKTHTLHEAWLVNMQWRRNHIPTFQLHMRKDLQSRGANEQEVSWALRSSHASPYRGLWPVEENGLSSLLDENNCMDFIYLPFGLSLRGRSVR